MKTRAPIYVVVWVTTPWPLHCGSRPQLFAPRRPPLSTRIRPGGVGELTGQQRGSRKASRRECSDCQGRGEISLVADGARKSARPKGRVPRIRLGCATPGTR
jgi:hypothetical protein